LQDLRAALIFSPQFSDHSKNTTPLAREPASTKGFVPVQKSFDFRFDDLRNKIAGWHLRSRLGSEEKFDWRCMDRPAVHRSALRRVASLVTRGALLLISHPQFESDRYHLHLEVHVASAMRTLHRGESLRRE
jgi:hypothetical protein